METNEIIALSAAIVGVVAALAAWWQACEASKSRKQAKNSETAAEVARDKALELSRKATAAAERQAVAQEEANRLELEARIPPPWTGPQYVKSNVSVMVNSSGSPVEVTSIDVVPDNMRGFVRVNNNQKTPFIVPEGGSLRYAQVRTGADLIKVRWRSVGDSESKYLRIPLL